MQLLALPDVVYARVIHLIRLADRPIVRASQRRVLGDEHRDTLLTVNNLGPRFLSQGKLAEAYALICESLRGQRNACHPGVLESMNSLANLLV